MSNYNYYGPVPQPNHQTLYPQVYEEPGKSIYGSFEEDKFFNSDLENAIERAKTTADKIVDKTFQPKFNQAVQCRCDKSPVWSWGSSWFSPINIGSGNTTVHHHYGSSDKKEKGDKKDKEGMSTGLRVALFITGGALAAAGSWLIGTNLATLEEADHQLGSNEKDRESVDIQPAFTTFKRSELESPHGKAIRRILDLEAAIFSRIRRNAQMNLFAAVSIVGTGVLGVGAGLAGSYVLVVAAGMTGLASACTWLVYKGYRYASTRDQKDAEAIKEEWLKLKKQDVWYKSMPQPIPVNYTNNPPPPYNPAASAPYFQNNGQFL